ncbi:MAG TPA: thiol reductant ABC exporter subunit CydD [Victivallales bacterium]|nr:thiol reductant ABC exporter subunit CydD [Victivallales bacterium]
MKVDRQTLSLIHDGQPLFILNITCGVLVTFTIVIQAYILSDIINAVFLHKSSIHEILYELIIFLILSFIRSVFIWSFESSSGIQGIKIKNKIRNRLNKHLTSLGPENLKNERSGEIVNTSTTGIESLGVYFEQYIPSLFLALLSPLIIVCFVFYIDPLSGAIFIITAPLIPFFMFLIGSKAKSMTDRQWKTLSYLSSHFLDVLQGLTTLKIFGQSKNQTLKISEISENFRSVTMKTLKIAFLSSLTLELISTLSIAIIAVSIGIRLMYGQIAYEEALFILIIAPELYAPLRNLGAHFHAGMEGMSSGKRIFEILDNNNSILLNNVENYSHPVQLSRKEYSETNAFPIKFSNVSFKYENESSLILSDISFEINKGDKIVINGVTGSGKSTIIKLLLGFILPIEGSIAFGNNILDSESISDIRSIISWVPQKPYLFNSSIRENICLGKPDANEKLIKNAVKSACLEEFISSLKNGYDTVIGERGTKLSGGQAQRLAIARALIMDSPILVMDESTSFLDPIYEYEILKNLQKKCLDKTVITIAHRLNIIKNADIVMTLNNGKLMNLYNK